MVGVLVRLRLRLLRNQLSRGTEQVVLAVLGGLFALGLAVGGFAGVAALRLASLDLAGAVVVVLGALAVLAWTLLPVLTTSDDVMNDPVRFALLPLEPRGLAAGLLVASAAAPLVAATLVASLALPLAFSRTPAAVVVAVPAALLGTATCLLASRTALVGAAGVLAGRRAREATVGVGVVLVSLLGFAGPVLVALGERLGSGAVDAAVQVLAWSPVGAVWAVPWAAAEGRWLVAGGRGVVALATLAVLWLVYVRAVAGRLVGTGGDRGRSRRPADLRTAASPFWSVLPDTPRGALVQRCMRYWVRDSRYVISLLALPVVVLLLLTLPALSDAPAFLALGVGPFIGLLLAVTMLNELAFDGTAMWSTWASAATGRDDRVARVAALLVGALPATVVVAAAGALVGGRPELIPALVGLSVGVLLVGNGVAAVSSVALPFAVPPAGSNPFAGNQGAGTAALVQQLLSMLVLVPLVAPLVGLAVWAWFLPAAGWLLPAVAVLYGGGVLLVGVRLGGRLFDARGPELLARLGR